MDTMTGSMQTEGYCRADDGQGITFPPTSPFLSLATLLKSAAGFTRGLRASKATPKYFDRLKRASLSTWFVALVRWDELQRYAVARRMPWPLSGPPRAFKRPSRFPM